jgi:tripartite-type tricarboxylate transporter receptor subunit TctC
MKSPLFRRRDLLGLATVGSAVCALPVWAQNEYPNKPIRLINPYPAGSPVEMVGRLVGERLRQEWNQPVMVESRTGAGGTVGTNFVAKAPADGYTLLVSVPSVLTVAPWTFSKLPYDPVKDIVPVWGVESGGIVMVVRNSLPAKSVREFLAYAQANPGKVNYGSAGISSPQHLAAELFMLRTKAKMNHVPFQGAAPALNNLLGGHIDVMFDSISNVLPHIRADKVRGLALLRPKRSPVLPELPTIAEAGVANANQPGSIGIYAPSGTPSDILGKWEQTLSRVMADPKTVEQLIQAGTSDEFLVGREYAQRLADEREFFGKVVREAGVPAQ